MLKNHKPIVISVEGIISAGKSCLIDCLVEKWREKGLKVRIIGEPIDKWGDILPLFCGNPERWAYHFQTKVVMDKIIEARKAWEQYRDIDIFITERSLFSDRLFMDTLLELGKITEMEMEHYLEWRNLWNELMPFTPDLFLYLTLDIGEAMNRKTLRGRPGEENITENYQQILGKYHDLQFPRGGVIHNGSTITVMMIDSHLDYKNDGKVRCMLANNILKSVDSILDK